MAVPRIGFLLSHPIQYYTPIFRALANRCDLQVFFAHRQSAAGQADAGFGVAFEWDIDLLSGYESKFLQNVARHPSTDRFNGCDTPGIGREIAEGRFDALVVPGWALRTYWQGVLAGRKAGVTVLVRGDSQLGGHQRAWVRLAKRLVFAQVLRRFDGFLYVGQRNREYLLHYGVPARRLFFSPHCIDNALFGSAAEAARRDRLADEAAKRRVPRILFVGKLMARKRPVDVLRAADMVSRRIGAVEVVFAGSGELEPELRRVAAETKVPTTFLGFVNQSRLPAVYGSADVIVLPSNSSETWGLVINEAMACGVPAVVSEAIGCAPDLVENGVTGATFADGDLTGCARAIESVLALDGAATRRHLAERMATYSPARAADGIVEAALALAARARAE
ncbi:MAG: glycosyltransferase family 4 protein [Reyranella sp.]|uniref:glycosyltransferase family 4 protein n=1 Tax=Reyranella sp. TaxID=1929291 RepID=UPI003D0E68F5